MDRIISWILEAEKSLHKGEDKKQFVISLFNSQLTENQQKTYEPIIDELVELSLMLMKSPAMIKAARGCFC